MCSPLVPWGGEGASPGQQGEGMGEQNIVSVYFSMLFCYLPSCDEDARVDLVRLLCRCSVAGIF